MKEEGKSRKEIKKAVSSLKNQHKKEKSMQFRQKIDTLKKERKIFKDRKKKFIAENIAQRKARGEKAYLRILAREEFEDMIIKENNRENKDDLIQTNQ